MGGPTLKDSFIAWLKMEDLKSTFNQSRCLGTKPGPGHSARLRDWHQSQLEGQIEIGERVGSSQKEGLEAGCSGARV